MKINDFYKKFRYSFYLPYGVASRAGLSLSIYQEIEPSNNPNNCASTVYDQTVPMTERENECERLHRTHVRRIEYMIKNDLVKSKQIKYGNFNWQYITYLHPAPSSFYELTNTVCGDEGQQKKLRTKTNKNRISKRKNQPAPADDYQSYKLKLNRLAAHRDKSPENAKQFRAHLLESVSTYDFSPLSMEPLLALAVNMTPTDRRQGLYRNLRLSNIEALFKANGYLTSIDRRPIETVTMSKTSDNERLDIESFCAHTLKKWYQENPEFYYFMQSEPDPEYKQNWSTTPVFYSVQEVPGFQKSISAEIEDFDDPEIDQNGNSQLLRFTCSGVAIGSKQNYIIHHTRPTHTPWYPSFESHTIKSLESIFKSLNDKQPFFGAKRGIRNAIIVCQNITHFQNLFLDASEEMEKKDRNKRRVGQPYDNVNIVLLSHSGATQLRFLMATDPILYDDLVRRKILTYEGFTDRPKSGNPSEDIFAVSYRRTPVLLAYSLNWQKLYWAMEKYEAGMKFYVCCYPEQAKYIRKIMPEVEFL